ncbi:membrane protein [Brevibacterium sediminis]|uniref:Membrane protein n=1 Tax=Brevibacterium sediminis TaxID=1857024 RepID=A0ABQ1MKJ7_9MICO|nr:permease [Brevibacterium sediminis]GGC42149.1 membrane protein [Brevibacterium sediminis]
MTHTSASAPVRTPQRLGAADWIGLGVLAVLLVVGLSWSKWLPYWDKAWTMSRTSLWDGTPLFDAAGDTVSLSGAWDFTLVYFTAVWKALLVALLVAAAIDALVPRDWLLRLLNRRSHTGQSLVGAALSMPSMMCTCCAAPVAAGLRDSGVRRSSALAYWVGNPLLNPAVIIFLALVLPWQYMAVRIVFALLVAVGAAALIGRWVNGPAEAAPEPAPASANLLSLPTRYLRSLARFTLILVPEHLALVFVIGLIAPWLTGVFGLEAQLGAGAVLIVAVVATLLVIPTGGEIPIILTLVPLGVGAGVTGALLIALPALSIPSMVMVGRAMGWKTTSAMGAAVAVAAVLAGGALALLS